MRLAPSPDPVRYGAASMGDKVEYVEARTRPMCPHCDATLDRIEYVQEPLDLEYTLMFKATYVIILSCPQCHKVLGSPTLQ
jgi:hypothetical protein